jgi:hypothetical protein
MTGVNSIFLAMLAGMAAMFLLGWIRIQRDE